MTDLQRITTEYVADEDRIRLSGLASDGSTVQLWLTQRLLNGIVPHLLGWLERGGPGGASASLVQEFAQHAARSALTPVPAVQAQPESSSWLVREVDLTSGAGGVGLRFKAAPGKQEPVVGAIALESQPLRQWLQILFEQYRKAGWPLGVWPDWFAPGAVAAPGAVIH